PDILTILQIPEIEIPGAPSEYKELALIESVITHPDSIINPAILQYVNWNAFSRQVFGFLRSQHKVGICYSSYAGCCLRPEFLCFDGSLTDAYFIDNPVNLQDFRRQAKTDVGNFLLVLCEAGIGTSLLREALLAGVKQYTCRETAADLEVLIDLIIPQDLDRVNLSIFALAQEIINFNDSFFRG
ncbi:MAG TPA: hypothetical protein VNV85_13465, partial [Puia sp.]|nr:hypothetical protein [Puia sp.]